MSYSCWFVLARVGLVLIRCWTRFDPLLDSCWFVLTLVGLMLIRVESCWTCVDSCWFVLIRVDLCWYSCIKTDLICFAKNILSFYQHLTYFQNVIEWIFCDWNSWHHNCETSMKIYWKSSEKFRKCMEKFKRSCNLCVIKVVNNLEITSVHV